MSTYILANEYKQKTGLTTKSQGLFYAKKLNMNTNRAIKDKNNRYLDFLIRLREEIADDDQRRIENNIIKYKVDPFIIKSDIDQKIRLIIHVENFDKNIKNIVNRREYKRKAFDNPKITIEFILRILGKMNQKKGKLLMLEIVTGTIDLVGFLASENNTTREFYKKGGSLKKIYYVVNPNLVQKLENIKLGVEIAELNYAAFDAVLNEILTIKIFYKDKTNKNNKRQGGFFKHYLDISGDNIEHLVLTLQRYQIYDKKVIEDDVKEINKLENCLIQALRIAEIDEQVITSLILKCKNGVIPATALKEIAEDNKLRISVTSETAMIYYYGDKKSDKKISLCLIDGHFFINEPVDISSYSIKNYELVKNEKEWWKITGTKKQKSGNISWRKESKSSNNSNQLVKSLIEEGFFKSINLTNKTLSLVEYNKIDLETINLDNSREALKYVEIEERGKHIISDKIAKRVTDLSPELAKIFKEGSEKIQYKIGFDFEATTETTNHIPSLVVFRVYEIDKPITKKITFFGENCAIEMLKYVKNIIKLHLLSKYKIDFSDLSDESGKSKAFYNLIPSLFDFVYMAHNLTYDIQFLMKHMNKYSPIMRSGTKVCGGYFRYGGLRFGLKDTYAILDVGLAGFRDNFGIEMEKEVMPYDAYTQKTVNQNTITIKEALDNIKGTDKNKVIADKKKFLENIKRLDLMVGNDHFSHMKYAEYYCARDVDVMMAGYFKFKEWSLEHFKINIDQFLTISAIADEHFKKQQCYNGCYYIDGIARYYIQQTVVGGRCMSKRNKKQRSKRHINDFDGVSLYPSAMKRLGEIGGYLKGKPKMITENNLNMNYLNKVDGYFIRIRLRQVRKHRDFPLASYINKDGIRSFVNDFDESNNIISINKIALEDLMTFQEVKEEDFDILDGYYFDEGRNPNILEAIQGVFDTRVAFKNQGNPIQSLFKLVMNSAYGKTIMKAIMTKLKYMDNKEDMYHFISINHNQISEIIKLHDCNKYLVKNKTAINDHSNACHIGSEILSMSKRIMNEIMCLAEDLDIEIYYQDTDSMHIENDKIELLSNEFKKKYNRELIGKKLGQFHSDFEPIKRDIVGKMTGKPVYDVITKEIICQQFDAKYAVETIILGKKAYIDLVEYTNGEIVPHCRMKGIRSEVVEIKAKKDFKAGAKVKFEHRQQEALKLGKEFERTNTYIESDGLLELYEHLYEYNAIKFDLLSNDKPIMKIGAGSVSNVPKFTRIVKFKEPDNEREERERQEQEDEQEPETIEDVFDNILD